MNIDYDDHDESLWFNVKYTVNYLITNYYKFILLILVFFIIYFVDYISNINAFIYNSQAIPGLTSLKTPTPPLQTQIKMSKKNKTNQKNRRKL
jgi:hypothetical protein